MGRLSALAYALFLGLGFANPAAAQGRVVIDETFSNGVDAWERVRLDRRPTAYAVTSLAGEQVLVATSDNAAAAVLRRVETDTPARAVLEWRWRIAESLSDNHDELTRHGDDYAARVFVIFGDEPFKPGTRALCYVWAGQQPIGAHYENPVIEDVATFVVRSGNRRAGRWVREQRDVVTDYQTAFGEPPPPVTGVAIMVDTDDTGSSSIAWFDDLRLEVQPAREAP